MSLSDFSVGLRCDLDSVCCSYQISLSGMPFVLVTKRVVFSSFNCLAKAPGLNVSMVRPKDFFEECRRSLHLPLIQKIGLRVFRIALTLQSDRRILIFSSHCSSL